MHKRVTALILAGAVVAGLAVPALAGKNRGPGNWNDVAGFEWGTYFAIKARENGLMQGRGNGIFAPGAPITRQEAAVAIVRLMGKEAEARSLPAGAVQAALQGVADRSDLAAWAGEYVAYLALHGVIPATGGFAPEKQASRLWLTVALVQALGFENLAAQLANAPLPFADAAEIPAELRGYVAAALQQKIIRGFEDNTFKPERAVRRIEMAVMLGFAGEQAEAGRTRSDRVGGTVRAAGNGQVTLAGAGTDATYTLAAGAVVAVNHRVGALAEVLPGMKARLHLNAAGLATFVDAEVEAGREPVEQEFTATFQAYVPAGAAGQAAILVVQEGGEHRAVPVAAGARIQRDLAQLAAGTALEVKLLNGVLVRAHVEDVSGHHRGDDRSARGEDRPGSRLMGTIAFITPEKTALAVDTGSATPQVTYTFAPGADLKAHGRVITVNDLQVGDRVELELRDTVILKLRVEDPRPGAGGGAPAVPVTFVLGTVAMVTPDLQAITVVTGATGAQVLYTFAPGADLKAHGRVITPAALRVGSLVELAVSGIVIRKLRVED